MSLNFEHAMKYWRKVFVSKANGSFTAKDFDKLFNREQSEQPKPGSKMHRSRVLRDSLEETFLAALDDRFGSKAEPREDSALEEGPVDRKPRRKKSRKK